MFAEDTVSTLFVDGEEVKIMVLVLDQPPHGSTFNGKCGQVCPWSTSDRLTSLCLRDILWYSACAHNTRAALHQAGNTSALAYRTDIGIPGYTGFIPLWASQPLFPKGGTVRSGTQPKPLACLVFRPALPSPHQALSTSWSSSHTAPQQRCPHTKDLALLRPRACNFVVLSCGWTARQRQPCQLMLS